MKWDLGELEKSIIETARGCKVIILFGTIEQYINYIHKAPCIPLSDCPSN